MSEAFYCDRCDEYKDGKPTKTLYKKESMKGGGSNFVSAVDLCDGCWAEVME